MKSNLPAVIAELHLFVLYIFAESSCLKLGIVQIKLCLHQHATTDEMTIATMHNYQ